MENIKEDMQLNAFQIIATVGSAKSMYLEALESAKEGDFLAARKKLVEGKEIYSQAHQHHFDLIAKESQGVDLPFSLIFMHAEDQLLNTETIEILITEMINMYEKISV